MGQWGVKRCWQGHTNQGHTLGSGVSRGVGMGTRIRGIHWALGCTGVLAGAQESGTYLGQWGVKGCLSGAKKLGAYMGPWGVKGRC